MTLRHITMAQGTSCFSLLHGRGKIFRVLKWQSLASARAAKWKFAVHDMPWLHAIQVWLRPKSCDLKVKYRYALPTEL
ncbi:MAG: hypothetical protein AB7E29_01175 [Xanthobacter sp.]